MTWTFSWPVAEGARGRDRVSGMEKRWPVLIVGAKEIARELGLGFRQVKKMPASG